MKNKKYKMNKLIQIQKMNFEIFILNLESTKSEFEFEILEFKNIINKYNIELLIKSKKLLEVLDEDNEFDNKILIVLDNIIEKVGVAV